MLLRNRKSFKKNKINKTNIYSVYLACNKIMSMACSKIVSLAEYYYIIFVSLACSKIVSPAEYKYFISVSLACSKIVSLAEYKCIASCLQIFIYKTHSKYPLKLKRTPYTKVNSFVYCRKFEKTIVNFHLCPLSIFISVKYGS